MSGDEVQIAAAARPCEVYPAPGQDCMTAGPAVIAAEGLCGPCAERVVAAAKAEALRETCREWPEDADDRCNAPADFILWGKLFPPEALGPRCYDHAVKHAGHSMPSRVDQWAVFDLRVREARDA